MNPISRLRHRHHLRNWLDMLAVHDTVKRSASREKAVDKIWGKGTFAKMAEGVTPEDILNLYTTAPKENIP